MRILAIETSCDETAAALVEERNGRPNLLTNVVASQIATHAETGGVIPDIAARMHTEAIIPVLNEATANKELKYDALAVTVGPGLIGSLLIGSATAKTIAMQKNSPVYPINHLEGHLYSAFIENDVELPVLAIIVSGGHTELVLMERHLQYQLLGSTRDDAAGEAFDKVARLLDLPYPGGPAIGELAVHGKPDAYQFPIALKEKENLDFSFSGIKAAVAELVSKMSTPIAAHTKADIAASFQQTVTDTIIRKTTFALKKHPTARSVCLVGGVAANKHLRHHLERAINQNFSEINFFVPGFKYCTDNAAMIASAAVFHYLFGRPSNWYDIEVDPSLDITSH